MTKAREASQKIALKFRLAFFQLWQSIFVRRRVLSLADQAIVSGVNFISGVLIARMCGKEEFGLYSVAFTAVIIATGIQSSLVTIPFTVYYARTKEGARQNYMLCTLVHQILLSVVIMMLILSAGFLSLFRGGETVFKILMTLSGLILFILLREFFRQFYFAKLETRKAFFFDVAVSLVQLGLLAVMTLQGLSAVKGLLAMGIACAATTLPWIVFHRKDCLPDLPQVVLYLRKHWHFGKWLGANTLVFMLGVQMYPFVLAYYHGLEETGVLAACSGVLYFSNPFIIGLGNYLQPRTAHAFAEGGASQVHRVVVSNTILAGSVMGVFCLLIIIMGDLAVTLVYGAKFRGVSLIVQILALRLFFDSLSFSANVGFLSLERPDLSFKANLLGFVMAVVGGIWLTKAYSAIGVALALLLTAIAMFLFRYFIFRRITTPSYVLR